MMNMAYPTAWKTNRMTLIFKPGKYAEEVSNLRPIIIGSLLGRLFLVNRKVKNQITQYKNRKISLKKTARIIAILNSVLKRQ